MSAVIVVLIICKTFWYHFIKKMYDLEFNLSKCEAVLYFSRLIVQDSMLQNKDPQTCGFGEPRCLNTSLVLSVRTFVSAVIFRCHYELRHSVLHRYWFFAIRYLNLQVTLWGICELKSECENLGWGRLSSQNYSFCCIILPPTFKSKMAFAF